MKKKKLEWNAFYYDTNTKEIKTFNVIRDDLIAKVKKAKKKDEDIKDVIKTNLMSHYWCKSEYEVVITDLFHAGDKTLRAMKIDVWWQLEMNLDRIVEYIERSLFDD